MIRLEMKSYDATFIEKQKISTLSSSKIWISHWWRNITFYLKSNDEKSQIYILSSEECFSKRQK